MSDIGAPGASQGGQGSGMGSGHGNQNQGSPSGGHPDNDPSTGLSYGSNQTEADLNFQDFDAVENAMRSTLYGAYDGSHLAGVVQSINALQNAPPKSPHIGMNLSAPKSPHIGMNLSAAVKDLQSPNRTENYERNIALGRGLGLRTQDDIDKAAQLAEAAALTDKNRVEAYNAFHDALNVNPDPNVDDDTINAPQNPMETAQFNMQALASHLDSAFTDTSTFETPNVSTDTAIKDNVNYGNLNPVKQAPHALDVIEQENIAKALAVKNAAKNISLNAPTTAPLGTPTKAVRGYEGSTPQLGALTEQEVGAFLDHVESLSKTEQEKAVKEFMEKNKLGIENINKNYAKEHPINPAVPGLGIMGSALTGLLGKMGIDPQINSPAIDALEQKARTLGLLDKESGEITEAELMVLCNSTPGHTWNSETKTCDVVSGSGHAVKSIDIVNPANPGVMDVVNPTLYDPEPQD